MSFALLASDRFMLNRLIYRRRLLNLDTTVMTHRRGPTITFNNNVGNLADRVVIFVAFNCNEDKRLCKGKLRYGSANHCNQAYSAFHSSGVGK